jgi:hypothetical protein
MNDKTYLYIILRSLDKKVLPAKTRQASVENPSRGLLQPRRLCDFHQAERSLLDINISSLHSITQFINDHSSSTTAPLPKSTPHHELDNLRKPLHPPRPPRELAYHSRQGHDVIRPDAARIFPQDAILDLEHLLLELREVRGPDSGRHGLADTGGVCGCEDRCAGEQSAVEVTQVGDGGEEGFFRWGEDRGWG